MSDQEQWDAVADDWDDLAKLYATSFYRALESKQLLPHTDSKVLDFGCGTGLLIERLHSKCNEIIAMDPSSGMIDILLDKIRDREWHNVKPMKTVITRADSKEFIDRYNNQFDLIVASSVLNCIPETDQRKTVEALAQLLKTGGHFCHSDWPEEATEHPNGMTLDKVEQLYAGTGLSIIEAGVMDFFIGSRGDKTPVFFVVGTK